MLHVRVHSCGLAGRRSSGRFLSGRLVWCAATHSRRALTPWRTHSHRTLWHHAPTPRVRVPPRPHPRRRAIHTVRLLARHRLCSSTRTHWACPPRRSEVPKTVPFLLIFLTHLPLTYMLWQHRDRRARCLWCAPPPQRRNSSVIKSHSRSVTAAAVPAAAAAAPVVLRPTQAKASVRGDALLAAMTPLCMHRAQAAAPAAPTALAPAAAATAAATTLLNRLRRGARTRTVHTAQGTRADQRRQAAAASRAATSAAAPQAVGCRSRAVACRAVYLSRSPNVS